VIEIGYQWLTLLPDETDPRVLESVRPSLVVWSSTPTELDASTLWSELRESYG
jgi:hypothetical protein